MLDFLTAVAENKTVVRIVAPIVLLGILIFVHEFGHFLFAKLFGVGVEKFSFGFGPRIVGVQWRGTEYRLSWIPLGGYVKMAGDDPFEEPGTVPVENALQQKPAWQRFLIFTAGPVFNLLLPVLLFAGVYMAGPPEPVAWVGRFDVESPAREAGLQLGDRIVAVDGTRVRFFEDLQNAVVALPRDAAPVLEVERDGTRVQVTVPLHRVSRGGETDEAHPPNALGILPYATVSTVGIQESPDSPAYEAGLRSGDRIVAIDGSPVSWWFEVDARLRKVRGRPVVLDVERDGTKQRFTLSPRDYVLVPGGSSPGSTEPLPVAELGDTYPGAPYGLFPAEIFVDQVIDGRPASRAGIEAGDMVLEIDGRVVRQWTDIQDRVESGGDQPRKMVLLRRGRLVPVVVTPEVVTLQGPGGQPMTRHQIGIVSAGRYEATRETLRLGPVAAVTRGAVETFRICVESVRILGHIILGDVPLSESLGGPISIVTVAAKSAAVSIFSYLRVMALISVSLGLINLLPIPLLDGGHIAFLFLEFVRGRPVSMRFREVSQQIGMIILFILMAFALANDVRINYFR